MKNGGRVYYFVPFIAPLVSLSALVVVLLNCAAMLARLPKQVVNDYNTRYKLTHVPRAVKYVGVSADRVKEACTGSAGGSGSYGGGGGAGGYMVFYAPDIIVEEE